MYSEERVQQGVEVLISILRRKALNGPDVTSHRSLLTSLKRELGLNQQSMHLPALLIRIMVHDGFLSIYSKTSGRRKGSMVGWSYRINRAKFGLLPKHRPLTLFEVITFQ